MLIIERTFHKGTAAEWTRYQVPSRKKKSPLVVRVQTLSQMQDERRQ